MPIPQKTQSKEVPAKPHSGEDFSKKSLGVNQPDLFASAYERGQKVQHRLLYEGDSPLEPEDVAKLLKITLANLEVQRKEGLLLGIPQGERYLYPGCQFHDGKVLAGLEQVLKALSEWSPWMQLSFLRNGEFRLAEPTPIDSLKKGKVKAVVLAAQCYGNHGAA